MSDPTNKTTGATPPETPPAGEGETQAAPAYAAAAAATSRSTPWYRRKWALVSGAVAAGVILFLGGMAVGSTFDGHGREGFDRDFHGQAPSGQGFGQHGWGDNGGQGFGQGVDPDGDDWQGNGQGGQGYGQPQQAPSTAPSVTPSTVPQAYYQ